MELIDLVKATGSVGELNKVLEKLWKTGIPSKVVIFGLRLFRNSLPTCGLLLQRHIISSEVDAVYPFCSLHCEESQHIFYDCRFTIDVWNNVCLWLRVQNVGNLNLIDHFGRMGKICKGKKDRKSKYLIWLTTCWCIWLSRNGLVFRNEEPSIESVITRIKSLSWSWFVYRVGSSSNLVITSWWNNPL